jgi:hypothetical protein
MEAKTKSAEVMNHSLNSHTTNQAREERSVRLRSAEYITLFEFPSTWRKYQSVDLLQLHRRPTFICRPLIILIVRLVVSCARSINAIPVIRAALKRHRRKCSCDPPILTCRMSSRTRKSSSSWQSQPVYLEGASGTASGAHDFQFDSSRPSPREHLVAYTREHASSRRTVRRAWPL